VYNNLTGLHAPPEDKSDYTRGSFYEELKLVFAKIPKCHMKILLDDFKIKVGENIFSN
jgi:hypothetical protein